MANSGSFDMVDPAIFEHLQTKIDEDSQIREELRSILQVLEKEGGRATQSILSRAHSTPTAQRMSPHRKKGPSTTKKSNKLVGVANKHPYYKYNGSWTKDVQNTCFEILLCGWLGGMANGTGQGRVGRLLTIEEIGQVLSVPVNLKDRDAFHLSIEEYLHSLISLIDELARLAVNSVTLGDYKKPLQISQFIKDIHAGFQLLNLKNDALRRRSDSIKYSVKKVEDVVYDLSLRNLVPPTET
ncbi:hypothetical protein MMC13_005636 [Lambiella insularis]|nr:hypothetical protein [Lambiella insularis]